MLPPGGRQREDAEQHAREDGHRLALRLARDRVPGDRALLLRREGRGRGGTVLHGYARALVGLEVHLAGRGG